MTAPAANVQKQLYGIALFEEQIVLSDFTDGHEKRFCVNPEQMMAFFRTEVTFRPFPGLVWMKSNVDNETFLLVLPPGPRTLLYRRGKKLTDLRLTLPSIAVRARFDVAQKVDEIHMWGLSGRTLTAETILYELPLPNLGGSRLCLGGTERIFGGNVIGAVERTIFDTPFNHHNYIVGLDKLPFHDYVKKYQGKCPLRTLKRIGTGREIL